MRKLVLALPLLVTAPVLLAQAPHAHPAVRPAASAATAGGAARTLTITARDYAFDAPDTVPAGLTTIRLVNRGPELHHVQLMRFDQGKRAADFYAALKAGGPPPAWAHDVGGPNTPVPGGESWATLTLTPGHYLIACFIPSADGAPHVTKGMTREIVVTGGAARKAAAVAAPARGVRSTITLDDYDFRLSRPLVAGRQTVRVKNVAAQSHEVLIVRLAPGKTPADLVAWVEKQEGPPPGAPVGGTTAMAKGEWNDIALTLEPGEYGLLCLIPDAGDGKPHVAHGMLKQIRVGAAGTRPATARSSR